ncbi:FHA domain-containing protein [Nannocystaceae bacterium ST9]
MPDKIPCPACGTDNPLSALQCQVCDYDLVTALPEAPAGARSTAKCPRCGSMVAGGAAYCPVCGQSMNDRFPRPPTAALNVRKLFGDLGDAPQPRGHLRERTEMAPSAAAYGNPMAKPAASPGPAKPASPQAQSSAAPVQPSTRESSDARRRRPAPRPQPQYSGFDPADSGRDAARSGTAPPSPQTTHGEAAPYMQPPRQPPAGPVTMYAGAFGPPPADPEPSASTSSGNTPMPRIRARAHAEPVARRTGAPSLDARAPSPEARAPAAQMPVWGAPQPAGASLRGATRTRLVLVGRDGQEGETFSIPAHGIEIGRQGELRFPADPFISPHHCRVTLVEGGGVGLQDLDSRNGVYVRLREGVAVYPGDFFLLGNELLRLDRVDPKLEQPAEHDARGFGTPAKPAWAVLTRVCVGDIDDDRYHLRGNEMVIGREDGDIVFPQDGFLSRQHARVRMEVRENSMTVMLEDLDSANGTYLRIRRTATVVPGGMFRVGDQVFRVRAD